MLPRSQRLTTGSDISRVSRTGVRARSGDLLVSLVPAAGDGPFRAAVVVGKPAGDAVTRNRLRRRIRHALIDLGAAVPAGSDLVVRGGPAALTWTAAELSAELRSAVLRAGRRAAAVAAAGPASDVSSPLTAVSA